MLIIDQKLVLRQNTFEINYGDIGIIGKTGCGKSTLVDLIMGLLRPTSGKILLDDFDLHGSINNQIYFRWLDSIGHVAQNIYLTDDTIASNIALASKRKI